MKTNELFRRHSVRSNMTIILSTLWHTIKSRSSYATHWYSLTGIFTPWRLCGSYPRNTETMKVNFQKLCSMYWMNLGFCGQWYGRAETDDFEVSAVSDLDLHRPIAADCLHLAISQPNEYATRTERNYEYKNLFTRFLMALLKCTQ